MSDFKLNKVDQVLRDQLNGFDEDLLSYIVSIVEEMTLDERRSTAALKEAIGPFLIDTQFSASESEVEAHCKR